MNRYYITEDPDGRFLYDTKTGQKILRCEHGHTYSPEIVLAQVLNYIDENYKRRGDL